MRSVHRGVAIESSDSIMIVIQFIILIPTLIGACLLWTQHFQMIKENITSAEARKKDLEERYYHPYDIGMYNNMRSVLGPKIWLWLLPSKPEGDGLTFKENRRKLDA